MKRKNIINERFGKLLVLSEHSKTRNGHYRYICQCNCGNQCNILQTHLLQGNTTSCGCDKKRIGNNHHQWDGVGQISGNFWNSHIVKSANGSKRKKIDLFITKEYAWQLFLNQNGKCNLSGLDLKFPTRWKDKSWTASLDRIDSSKGYIEGNVQWIHKDINIMKNKFSQEYFIRMCNLITNNQYV